jgi:hypothetical protein
MIGPARTLTRVANRAAAAAAKPAVGVASGAAHATVHLSRRGIGKALSGLELENALEAFLYDPRAQRAFSRALDSKAARDLVATFFNSGAWDEFANRLLESKQLWTIVDVIATSPSVTAAITQQGFGFADQVGDQVRYRSREADAWLERAVRRRSRRHEKPPSVGDQGLSGATQ